MTKPADFTDLDALLTKAMARQTPKKERRRPEAQLTVEELAEAERKVLARWRSPENWERTRNVVLIHVSDDGEQETLLGNFVEYKHKLSVGICRRLVRDLTPAAVGEIEHVKGNNWLGQRMDLEELRKDKLAERAEETREAIVDLHLPELDHVFSPAVMVVVQLLWGGISQGRADGRDAVLLSKDHSRCSSSCPAGMDVLEGMSLDCKLKLREWLGL
jgi:hypothetical protein